MAVWAAVFAAVGKLMEGRAQAGELRDQANVEAYHAGIAGQNAVLKGQQTSAAEEALRRDQRQFLGKQRAAVAESGTGMSGSNEDVMRQSAALAELDALNVQFEGNIERNNLLEQKKMHLWNKDALRKKARAIMHNRWVGAAGAGMSAYGGAGGGAGGGMGGATSSAQSGGGGS
jgi:hypothetical protein